MRAMVLLIAGLVVGCATTSLTEEETAVCKGNQPCLVAALEDKVIEEQFAAEDRRIQRRDEIVGYILACHYAGHVMFYKRSVGGISSSLIDRHGVVHVPKHANMLDFSCVSPSQANEILRGLAGSDPRYGGRDRF